MRETAHAGGADRLEVVREIERDGLTPSLDLVRALQAEVPLPLRVMVRESDGFGITGPEELRTLQRTIGILADLGVHGAVVGFARDGRLDLDAIRAVLSAAPTLPVTLHRAFDSVADPLAAIDEALTLPADRPHPDLRRRRRLADPLPPLQGVRGAGRIPHHLPARRRRRRPGAGRARGVEVRQRSARRKGGERAAGRDRAGIGDQGEATEDNRQSLIPSPQPRAPSHGGQAESRVSCIIGSQVEVSPCCSPRQESKRALQFSLLPTT